MKCQACMIEGLRLPSFRERFAEFADALLRRDPAYFAVCCCFDRDCYIGRVWPEARQLDVFGCMSCPKFARGCWGPRVEARG